MSVHAMELALFDIASLSPQDKSYRANPQDFLGTYRLQPDELQQIVDMDVRAMMDLGVSPMLTMRAFISVNGRAELPEYMRRIQPRRN